jgi:hypothetical protein
MELSEVSELADVIYSQQQKCLSEQTETEKMMRRASILDFASSFEQEPRKATTFEQSGAQSINASSTQVANPAAKKPQTVVFNNAASTPGFTFEKTNVVPAVPKAKPAGGLSMLLNPTHSSADSKPMVPSGPTFKVSPGL